MESPGKYLKAERESRNRSLREISESTKIKERLLKAIEEDQYELISSPVYVKGFLEAYARYLGLDPNDIVLRYQKNFEKKSPSKGSELKPRITSSKWKQWINFLKKRVNARSLAIYIFAVLFVVIFIYASFKLVHRVFPSFSKKESRPALSSLAPSSPPVQKEAETQTTDQPEKNQTHSMDTNRKDTVLQKSVQFEVVEAGLGTGIEQKHDFLNLTGKHSEFVCNNQKVYFVTKVKAKEKGKVAHVWFWNGKEFHKREIEIKPPERAVYSYITLRVGHTGDWKIEVRHKSEVLTSLSFKTIQPASHSTSRKQ